MGRGVPTYAGVVLTSLLVCLGCQVHGDAMPTSDTAPTDGAVERGEVFVQDADASWEHAVDDVVNDGAAGDDTPWLEPALDSASDSSDATSTQPVPPDSLEDDGPLPPIGCGNGVLEPGEGCDDGAENSDDVPDACRTDCTPASCGDGVVDGGEGCDDGNEDETDSCLKSCIPGPSLRKPAQGEVVFTELMIDPVASDEYWGEWVEMRNVTDEVLSLVACELVDEGGDVGTLGIPLGTLVITPHSEIVVGPTSLLAQNGGVLLDGLYTNMLLANGADTLGLLCEDVLVDVVAYDALAWPLLPGHALSLDPDKIDTLDNDEVTSWCAAFSPYGLGDFGTPGVVNPPCPVVDDVVDECGVVLGFGSQATVGELVPIGLNVTDVGLNIPLDLERLKTQATWLQEGQSPEEAQGWVSLTTVEPALPQFVSTSGSLSVDLAGTLRLLGRVSIDDGVSWRLCDALGEDDSVFDVTQLPTLDAIPHPCDGMSCDTPPGPLCLGDGVSLRLSLGDVGLCTVEQGYGACTYESEVIDCGLQGAVCEGETACYTAALDSPTLPGALLITELMISPESAATPSGQWVEIYNPLTSALDLSTCKLQLGLGGQTPLIDGLVIGPESHRILGRIDTLDANGGVTVDWAYGAGFELPSGGASLSIICGGVPIDSVDFAPGSGWPTSVGASLALSPYHHDHDANDVPDAWCTATAPFGLGDAGSPGQMNPPCPGDLKGVDSCRLVGASPIALPAGVLHPIVMELSIAGVTDQSPITDLDEDVLVEFWWAADSALPSAPEAWSVQKASALATWDSGAQGLPFEVDAYVAEFLVPEPGLYQSTFRASADGGNSWRICDRVDDAEFVQEHALSIESLSSPCHPSPCLEQPPLTCLDDAVVANSGASSCMLEGTQGHRCEWEEVVVVEDCAAQGASCELGVCVDFPESPEPGDVIFSELLVAPVEGETSEWFELSVANEASANAFQLSGCLIQSAPAEVWHIDFPELSQGVILKHDPHLYTRSLGQSHDAVYGDSLSLDNTADTLTLICDGVLIDQVTYDGAGEWPLSLGVPMGLGANVSDANSNDSPVAWCALSQALDGTPLASPGDANGLCPPHDADLDACFLMEPESLSVESGAVFSASMLVYDEGMTDETPMVDPAPGVAVEIGLGPVGSQPSAAALQWLWVAAYPDPGWSDGDEPGFDRWTGPVAIIDSGHYDLAMRITLDGGSTWTYCDLDGIGNGYQPEQAGQVSVTHAACSGIECGQPPDAFCDEAMLVAPYGQGVCVADPVTDEPSCTFETHTFDCAPFGGCDVGKCVDSIASPSAFGELVISEFMRDSLESAPDHGEWVEIHNASGQPLDLRGCSLSPPDFTVTRPVPVVLWPGQYALLGSMLLDLESLSAPESLLLPTPLLGLPNVAGALQVVCDGAVIDDVAYTLGWPGQPGVAAQLDADALPPLATANDAVGAWCDAPWDGELNAAGTPGAPNQPCPKEVD